MTEDYYEVLGVNKSASDAELKSAFKKAARKYHPDNSDTGNEDMFKKVGEAYEVLKDPQKRQIYDQYGAEGLKGAGGFGGASGFEGFGGAGGFEDLGDIFSSFFGGGFSSGGRSRNAPSRGHDHEVSIQIDFLDPITDTEKKIRLNPLEICDTCDGKGAEKESDISTCSTCNGTGQVSSVQNTIFGQVRQNSTCPTCGGSGKEIKNPCKSCKGRGYKRVDKEIEIKIPAGIQDGTTMRLSGMGDIGKNGGPRGDIYLTVRVREHSKFRREGSDIYSVVKLGLAEAALGTELKIPTIYGNEKLKIKAGTQAAQIYTLKDKGMPLLNRKNHKGHHYVEIDVQIPTNLSREEKKLLEQFQKLRRGQDIEV